MSFLYPGDPNNYPANIRLVNDGDAGDADTLNAPWSELADRTAFTLATANSALGAVTAIQGALNGTWKIADILTLSPGGQTEVCLWDNQTGGVAWEYSDPHFSFVLPQLAVDQVFLIAATGIFFINEAVMPPAPNDVVKFRLVGRVDAGPLEQIGSLSQYGGTTLVLPSGPDDQLYLPFSMIGAFSVPGVQLPGNVGVSVQGQSGYLPQSGVYEFGIGSARFTVIRCERVAL